MHARQSLCEHVHAPETAGPMQAIEPMGGAEKAHLEEEDDDLEADRKSVVNRIHGASERGICQQDPAARRRRCHCEKVANGKVGAAAIENVGGVHGDPARAHGADQIALAAEVLSDTGRALQQRLMHEKRLQPLRRCDVRKGRAADRARPTK